MFVSSIGAARGPTDDFWYGPISTSAAGSIVSADTAMRLSTVYKCVRVRAETIGMLPLQVYRRLPNGGKEADDGHPLAGLLHEQAGDRPDLLNRAVPHYHSALQLVLREEAPLLWASAHANLATAYLTMPMTEASSQLRLGVAAQSLRSALKVYTPEDYPEQWASVQLNLANSLVYTPSSHQVDNLVEAVELYEAVLAARDRGTDPLGRARVLANQGNVFAHLGDFDQAKAKLYDARFLFEELGDHESVRTVRGILDEVSRQSALTRTDSDEDARDD